jgi:methionyl-tRNA synthetase
MLKAESEGVTPEQLVARIAAERPKYLQGFHIEFDNWYSTHSPENSELSQDIYRRLDCAKLIDKRAIEQFYDPVKNMFLADRYIKGECPKCGAKDQYGDACEVCGSVYAPTDLKNPYSTLSGAAPVLKTSEHYFFKLSDPKCVGFIKQWLEKSQLQPQVANKAKEWLEGKGDKALGDWDISRDAPYFGIPIPDAPGKYFYVWLDAPVGYLASLKNYLASEKYKENAKARGYERVYTFNEFLADSTTEQIHFIGKDIIYFHTLFWPAMLEFANRGRDTAEDTTALKPWRYKVPTQINVHGFITVSGEKMSKSRGTGISPLRYLEVGMNPEWLRYYIGAKLNASVEDIDFNPDDFMARVNSDLIGKYVNILSRATGFITKKFDGVLLEPQPNIERQSVAWAGTVRAISAADEAAQAYEEREFGKAVRAVMRHADRINKLFDDVKPWELAKQQDQTSKRRLHEVCSDCINAFKILTYALAPILPATANRVGDLLGLPVPLKWEDIDNLIVKVKPYKHVMSRVEEKQLDALFEIDPSPPATSATGAGGEGKAGAKKRTVPQTLLAFARKLRTEQTDAEQLIWALLRDGRIGKAKFRRQHPIEVQSRKYILDFYCDELKLAVELDGGQRQERSGAAEAGTNELNKVGIKVLRFSNNDVLKDTDAVLESLWNEIMDKSSSEKTLPSRLAPLPKGEGEVMGADALIKIDDFTKIDLRIAKITNAEHVEGADKLLKLTLDVGSLGARQVFAGIKSAYDPASLVGKLTVVVANLAPRKMKFGLSEGMILAASGDTPGIFLLSPDAGAQPGMRVK